MSDGLLPINGKSVIEYATIRKKDLEDDLINRIITVIEENIRDNAELGITYSEIESSAWENETDKKIHFPLPENIVCEIKNYFSNKYFFVKYNIDGDYLHNFFIEPQIPRAKEKKYSNGKESVIAFQWDGEDFKGVYDFITGTTYNEVTLQGENHTIEFNKALEKFELTVKTLYGLIKPKVTNYIVKQDNEFYILPDFVFEKKFKNVI